MNKGLEDIKSLHVLVMASNAACQEQLSTGLDLGTVERRTVITTIEELEAEAENSKYGAALVSIILDDGKEMLTNILKVAGGAAFPFCLFVDREVDLNLGEVIDAGICSVVVDGLAARRVPHLLATTVYRYNKMRGIQIQLEEAVNALEERKLVDRAKAILIEQRNVSEPEAYKMLRRAAMNKSCKISDIAQTVIIASEV